jgi:hypothetical protein
MSKTFGLRARALVLALAATLCALAGVLALATAPALAAGDVNNAFCANEALEGFRAQLPDCRAYEMVTPAFKDGSGPENVFESASGSRLIETHYDGASYAGDPSSYFEPAYEMVRTPSGWQTFPINPPESMFQSTRLAAASPELDKTLWYMRTPSQSINAEDLYLREPDGTFVLVGPLVPPSLAAGPPAGEDNEWHQDFNYKYVAASDNFDHVLFNARDAERWPGDTTFEVMGNSYYSLYEYTGTGNTKPELVGVSDGKTVAPGRDEGKTIPAGALISNCGTELGSYFGRESYNALSANGEVAYFTPIGHDIGECVNYVEAPETTELYARLQGIQTVPISEPSLQQCRECLTANRKQAEFAGASEDGSKAFFLTEQELLPEAKTMNLYEYDFDAPYEHHVVRVSTGTESPEVQGVARVSEDGSHVYFVAKGILTSGQNREGREPVLREDNLYVFERDAEYPGGRITFIATLSPNDAQDWSETDIRRAQATKNGGYLVFDSVAALTGPNPLEVEQVYEYDAVTAELVRVSAGGAESPQLSANIESQENSEKGQYASSPSVPSTRLDISESGAVIFYDHEALTPEATTSEDEEGNVYEFESSGPLASGEVHLIANGTQGKAGGVLGLDASAEDVFFGTSEQLVKQDTDTQVDIYDARIGGGSPLTASSTQCQGEGCYGPLSVQPGVSAPASVASSGEGPVPAPASPAAPPPVKRKPLTTAQKRAAALRTCKKEPKRKRASCEARAKQRFPIRKARG